MSNNYHEWADNEDITVDALNRLDKWKVNYFTDATDRDAVITSPEEGMIIYLTSVHRHQYWTGSTWAYLTSSAPAPLEVASDITLSSLLTALQTQGIITVNTVVAPTPTSLNVRILDNTGTQVEGNVKLVRDGAILVTNYTTATDHRIFINMITDDTEGHTWALAAGDGTPPAAQVPVTFVPNASMDVDLILD